MHMHATTCDASCGHTHTETVLYGAVEQEHRSARGFGVTRVRTGSIRVCHRCSRMSLEAVATGGPPCKASTPKCSVRRQSGPLWGPWTPPAIPGGIASKPRHNLLYASASLSRLGMTGVIPRLAASVFYPTLGPCTTSCSVLCLRRGSHAEQNSGGLAHR